jgi:hypothetical protein
MSSDNPETIKLEQFVVLIKKADGKKKRIICEGYYVENDMVYMVLPDDGLAIVNLNFVEDLTAESVSVSIGSPRVECTPAPKRK